MRNTFITLLILCSTAVFCQKKGIDFRPIELDKAMWVSASENKPVFMVCYILEDELCKKFYNQVLNQPEAGAYFNNKFVCIKQDMEAERDGFKSKYSVTTYPTVLVVNSKGILIHKYVGYLTTEELIREGKRANDPNKNMAALCRKMGEGNHEFDVMLDYLTLGINDDDKQAVLSRYFDSLTQSQRTEKNNMYLVKEYAAVTSQYFISMLHARQPFDEAYGKENMDSCILLRIKNYYQLQISRNNGKQAVMKELDPLQSPLSARAVLEVENENIFSGLLEDLQNTEMWKLFFVSSQQLINYYGETGHARLNHHAREMAAQKNIELKKLNKVALATNHNLAQGFMQKANDAYAAEQNK
jgi:hypothetical protein